MTITGDPAAAAVLAGPATTSGTVIGGPGTGKTTLLVERAARLMAEFGSTASVIAITPTRATATRLRDRIALRIGAATPGAPARSLGSLAFPLAQLAAGRLGMPSPRLLTGAEQDRIIAEILHGQLQDDPQLWPDRLPAGVRSGRAFRSELRAFFGELIERGVDSAELERLGHPVWTAVARTREQYLAVMGRMRSHHLDAAEMLAAATTALRLPGSLPGFDELRAVLVDDAQELTRGGVDFVEALRDRGITVMAFGDPDIGSGAFRGVTPDVFARLSDRLGAVHVLREDRRCAPVISRLVAVATGSIGVAGRVEHRRAPGPEVSGGLLSAVRATSAHDEVDRIAWLLRSWYLDDGIGWGRMAVIAHDTRQLLTLEAELAAREVPTRAAGVHRPLAEETAVRSLIDLITLALNAPAERDSARIEEALTSPYGGLDAIGLRRLRAQLRQAEVVSGGARSARELLRKAIATPASLVDLATREARIAERCAKLIAALARAAADGATVHDLLWLAWDGARTAQGYRLSRVWQEQARPGHPLAAETGRALDGLVALFDAAKRAVERAPQEGPGPFLRDILDSDVPQDSLTVTGRTSAVSLLTPASALGTEFDAVVIAGMQDGVWPNVRLRGGLLEAWMLPEALARGRMPDRSELAAIDRRREALSDELRLFVRAASRARERLVVTAVDDEHATPSALWMLLPEASDGPDARAEHPLTLRGTVARLRRELTTSGDPARRHSAAGQLAVLAAAEVPGADPDQWYGLRGPSTAAPLTDVECSAVRVSPSRLEAWETCALDWVIAALGGAPPTPATAGVGTLLHAALEASPEGDAERMRRVLDEGWKDLEFAAEWLQHSERRRADDLLRRIADYAATVRRLGGTVTGSEVEFRLAVPLDGGAVRALGRDDDEPAGHAVLRGVIDRLERFPAGNADLDDARGSGWEPVHTRDGGAEAHSVVVDLKTGRSEKHVLDRHVPDHSQLAAYQLAVEAGAVPGVEPTEFVGARLVVASAGVKSSLFRVAHQHLATEEERSAFLERIRAAAAGMAIGHVEAPVEEHCRDDRTAALCRIHTVPPVSAS